MSILELLVLLLIAAICGSSGQAIVGYTLGGGVTSSVIGLIGAFLGAWLARQLGLPFLLPINIAGNTFPVVWSVIGSAIFAAIAGFINRSLRTPPPRRY